MTVYPCVSNSRSRCSVSPILVPPFCERRYDTTAIRLR